MSNGVGKELYDDTAKFGLVMAFIGAIITTIIGVLFIVIGIYFVNKKLVYTASTTTDTAITSVSGSTRSDGVTNCTVGYTYTVGKNTYTKQNQTTSDEALCNYGSDCSTRDSCNITGFTVWYDPTTPQNSQLSSDSTHVLGWIGIVFGLFLLIVGWVSYYLKRRYKAYAAIGGVSSAIGGVQTIFGK
jgi:hypothetical protein